MAQSALPRRWREPGGTGNGPARSGPTSAGPATFRNQRRMNLLLGLMRLHRLLVDELDHYTTVLREAALTAGGRTRVPTPGLLPRPSV